MRKLPFGAAISLIVHAVALAYVALFVLPGTRHAEPDHPPVTIEVIPVAPHAEPPAEPPPLEVALLDEPPAVVPEPQPVAPPPQAKRPARHAPAAAIAAIAPHAGSVAEPPGAAAPAPSAGADPADPDEPNHRSLLAMRDPEAPNIAVIPGMLDAIASVPRGTPEVDFHTGLLHADGNGKQSEQSTFVVKIAPDGTVKITDKPSIGDVKITGLGIGLRFDVTDALMRSQGMDPYLAAKRKWLDATRDERAQMGTLYRKEQLSHATQLMLKNLAILWAERGSVADKKEELFEMWDDCADTGEDELVAAGDDARRMVIGFIRGHLPPGSADAYTPAELARLARHQQSKAAFQPYEP
jgi:hypothetical protein